MKTYKIKIVFLLIIAMYAPSIWALPPETLDQAKSLADNSNKPILIEFYRPDCEYCQLAAHEASTVDSVKSLLEQVVHFPVNVTSDEGAAIVANYYVGDTFPLFVLTDSRGEVLFRWMGYTNAASFIANLNSALAGGVTVKEREQRIKANPTHDDALFMARYYDDIEENLIAVDYYKQAQSLKGDRTVNYTYDIFRNFGDAVWNNKATFDTLLIAADSTLSQMKDKTTISGVARIISNVARKTGNTGRIAKYLQAAIDINSKYEDPKSIETKALYRADLALYADNDTSVAIAVRKSILRAGWETNPQERYNFAFWCLERKINLSEADSIAYETGLHIVEPAAQAKVYFLLGKIREAGDNINGAIRAMEKANELQPDDARYSLELNHLYTIADDKNEK